MEKAHVGKPSWETIKGFFTRKGIPSQQGSLVNSKQPMSGAQSYKTKPQS